MIIESPRARSQSLAALGSVVAAFQAKLVKPI
jgi:hypothetical protein